MNPGQRIGVDQQVDGGGAALRYQNDGNLVHYGPDGAMWSIDRFASPGYVEMQHDGNLVAYDVNAVPYWASDTYSPGARLEIRRSGLKIVAQDGSEVWSTSTGVEDLPEPPPITSALRGQVHIVGHAFHDDNGPCIPFQCHAGDLIGQGLVLGFDRARQIIDEIADAGYPIIRSWFQLKITTGKWVSGPTEQGWDPRSNPNLFLDILGYGADRGIKWNLSGGGIRGVDNREEDELFGMLRDCVRAVGSQHFFHIQPANEAQDTVDRDDLEPAELERLINIVRSEHPDILYTLTAYTGHEDKALFAKYTPRWAKLAVAHPGRAGHFWDKYRHLFSLMREKTLGRDVGLMDEPWGPGSRVSAQENEHELRQPGIMEGAVAMSAMCRQVWTYFCGSSGIVYNGFSDPGFRETPQMVAKLPRDLQEFQTLGHSHPNVRERIHTVRRDSPDVREDFALHDDGRFLAVRYGPPDQNFDFAVNKANHHDLLLNVPGVQVRLGQVD